MGGILIPTTDSRAEELQIDAESFAGESGTQVRAHNARLRYGPHTLEAGELLYDTGAGWVAASAGVSLRDADGNRLRSNLMDYFPLLSRAVAKGNVRYDGPTGVRLWAHLLRYEIDRQVFFLEGLRSLSDGAGRYLSANQVEYRLQDNTAIATGNVLLRTDRGASIASTNLTYKLIPPVAQAAGTVVYSDGKGMAMTATNLHYTFAEQKGAATDIQLRNRDAPGLVTAASARLFPDGYLLEEVVYTTCDPDDPVWVLEADSIAVGTDQVARATGAKLLIKGTPVLYLPQFSYNLSGERRSGILAPHASLQDGSLSVEVPIYFNLAPNYDAMLRLRLMSARGIYATVAPRWLLPSGRGEAEFSGIDDRLKDRFRGRLRVLHRYASNDGLRFELDASRISDADFADDFLTGDATATRHFIQSGKVSQVWDNLELSALVARYQTIRPVPGEVEQPYARLPELAASWSAPWGQDWLEANGWLTNFRRSQDPANGSRLHGTVAASRTLGVGEGSIEFTGGVAASRYSHSGAAWLVPHASIDVRPQFWSKWSFGERQLRQLFEPRLYVGLVPREDFSDVPVYDSTRVEAAYQDYFNINPFVGGDRFEDSSFMSVGLESKLWDAASRQARLSARLAQQFRLRDSRVQATNEAIPRAGLSNVITEIRLEPNRRNTFLTRLEWNPDFDSFEQASFEMQHRSDGGHSYRLSYYRNKSSVLDRDGGQVGVGFHHILSKNLQLAADINYNLENQDFSKVNTGIRYVTDCRCWSMDFLVEHEPLAVSDRTTFFVQVNLLGLGGLGSGKFKELANEQRLPL